MGYEFKLNDSPTLFDGCLGGILLEAKGERYEYLFGRKWGAEGMRGEADRQVNADKGRLPLEWHFAEQGAADFARDTVLRGLPISVRYTPADYRSVMPW
jgi:hypothetical protein